MPALITSFRYERPRSIAEAVQLVSRLHAAAVPFVFASGGTDLVPMWKNLASSPGTVISLTAIAELSGVDLVDGHTLVLGAETTLAAVAQHHLVCSHAPGLAEAAARVASPQIRHRATVGGNLLVNNRCPYFNQSCQNRQVHGACFKAGGETCHLIPSAKRSDAPLCQARFVSDLAPVLLVLGARLTLTGPQGQRHVLLHDFYRPDGIDRHQLAPDEILQSIAVPLSPPMTVSYDKLRVRNAIDFPSLGVAVATSSVTNAVSRDAQRSVTHLKVALTGVNTHPILLEYTQEGFPNQGAMVDQACADAQKAAVPLKQDFFPPAYRRKMIAVLLRRGFKKIVGEL